MGIITQLTKLCDQDAYLELKPQSKMPITNDWPNQGNPLDEVITPDGNLGLILGINKSPMRCLFKPSLGLFPLVIYARRLCGISAHHDVGAPLITFSKQIAGQCYIGEQLVDIPQRANF